MTGLAFSRSGIIEMNHKQACDSFHKFLIKNYFFNRFRPAAINPSRPTPNSTIVPGSGTGAGAGGAGIANAGPAASTRVDTAKNICNTNFFIIGISV
jgi:hypothetical protein